MMFHRLDLVDQGVESFQGLAEREREKFLVVNLQNNRIESFDFFGTHPYLSELHLQNNRIRSFRGLTKQASLRSLNLQGCPVARHPYYRIMALLTIGLGLEDVDGLPILSHERRVAKALGKRAALAVSYGWSLDLGTHTIAEYDAIIDEFRRRRQDECTQTHAHLLVTIEAVLTKLDDTQRLCGYDATAEFQLTDREKTITRLARRVEQVERLLAASTSAHAVPLLCPCGCSGRLAADKGTSFSSSLFSTSELALTDGMRFSQGIQFRHNLGADQAVLQRVCLHIDLFVLTVVSFFSREPLVQFTLCSLRCRHVGPLTLVAENEVGAVLEFHFDSPPLLRTVYKTLCTFSSRVVSAHSAIAPSELQRKKIQHDFQGTVKPTAVLMSSCTGSEVKLGNTSRARTERAEGVVKAASPAQRSTHQRLLGDDSATGDSAALESIEDVPPLQTGFSRPGTGGRPIGHSSEPNLWSRIAIAPVKDTNVPQTLGIACHVAVSPRATSVDGIASGSSKVGVFDVLSDTRRFHEFVGLDGVRTGTDLAAFHARAEGDCETPGESVSVPGKEGEAISKLSVLPIAQRAAASPFDCSEASVPPYIPSWTLEKDMISTAIPMVSAHKQDMATKVLSSRNPVLHYPNSPSTHHSVLNDSPGIGDRKWTEQHDISSLVRGSTTGAGGERESTGRPVTKDSAPPIVSSRFAALLISSDSDSERVEYFDAQSTAKYCLLRGLQWPLSVQLRNLPSDDRCTPHSMRCGGHLSCSTCICSSSFWRAVKSVPALLDWRVCIEVKRRCGPARLWAEIMHVQGGTVQNGAKHTVENAVSEVLNDAPTGRRANPHAIGFVRSNSYALTTRDTTYAVPDFFPLGGVAWPEALLALWRSMRYSSLTGVFAELYRAWFTVDNRLVLWDYRSGREFCIYDEIPELISVVGAPLRPLRDVFQPHISFLIPVGTTNMMFLLGLCVVGEGELAEMKVVNLGYSCSTDTVITRVIGSRGRVFCAGADGSLYELRYMRENTPITPKIRMVRYGVWFSNMPVLGQLSSTVSNFWKSWRGAKHGGLIDLVVDERDGVLATLCEDSTISLWRLHPGGGIRFLVSVPHRPDRLSRLYPVPHGEAAPLTRLFAIETDAQGCRFLATALNGDQFRYRYVNTFDSAFGAELSLQSHTPSYLSGKREVSVCYASASVFLAACSDTSSDRGSDEVFAATSPSVVMAPHQNVRDIIASFSGPPSRIVRVDAIEQMPTQTPRNLTDLCAQVCSPGPTYVMIHRHGISLFAQARPVDTLYLILSTGDADCREGLLGRFTSVYSVPDYASMLLQIAVGGLNVTTERPIALTKDSVLSSSDDDGASLNELGQKLLSGESAEVLRRARELLRNLQLPGTQATPTSASADVEVQQVVVLMSPFARGLVTFIARALCQLWNTAVGKIMECNLAPAVQILEKIIQYLDSLSIGGLPEHQRTLDFNQVWQSDKVVVSVPRSRGLRTEDVKRLQASMLHSCYELTHKAWQAATVLQRVLGFPLFTEVASVTFSEVIKDAAIAQRLGHHLSQVMLDSHQGTGADLGYRGVSFSQLQRLCPYFFSGISAQAYQLQNDMKSLTSGECLQSYTDAQVQKWAAEVGAKAAAYWPSGALQSICEQLRSIRRENVAVEILLHAAAQLDPSNAALDILLAEGRGQACDQTRYGSAYSLHQTKTQVLELVISTLESAWLTHRSVVDDLLGGPRRSGTIWQVEPSDEYAHCFLFEWMCTPRDDRNTTKSLRETLVRAQSPFLGNYLRRNAEVLTEEYAHYLANVQGDYQGAMQQCFVMALAPLPDTPVAERLPYRLRCLREALDCARRCQSDQIQQVEQQLRLMEAQQRLYRIVTEFISSGSATLDRRVEWEGQIMTERDVAVQHIEFLSSFVASASDIIEVSGMYPALGGAEVQLDALLCSYVTDVGVFATCVGRAYKNEKDTIEAITKRLIERYYHQISYFPLSHVVQLLEAKSFLRSPAGSAEVVELLLSLSVDPRVLFITYEKILEERDDTGVECVEFRDAGVTQGYLVHAYATVLVCLVDLSRRVSVQQWLVTNAMAATRTMIRRAASAVTSPNEQAAVEKAEELLRKANTIATAGVSL